MARSHAGPADEFSQKIREKHEIAIEFRITGSHTMKGFGPLSGWRTWTARPSAVTWPRRRLVGWIGLAVRGSSAMS